MRRRRGLADEELESLKDVDGEIRYEKVVKFLLPTFDGEECFELTAARIRSYMTHLLRPQGHRPQYYKPQANKVVLGSHAARFVGVQVA